MLYSFMLYYQWNNQKLYKMLVKCNVQGKKSKLLFQVDLVRSITFRNSKQTWNGIPIIAANMDTVGTFEMAKDLAKVGRE